MSTDPESGVRTTTYADGSMEVALEFSDGSAGTAHVEPTPTGHLSVADNPNDGTTYFAVLVGEWPNGNHSTMEFTANDPDVTTWAGDDGTTVTTIHTPDNARYSIIDHNDGTKTYVYVIPNADGTYEQTTKHPDGWSEIDTLVPDPAKPGSPDLVEQ